MLIEEVAVATFVSVGPEPGGVPVGVLPLGGGPRRFRELLAAQAALYPVTLPATPEQDPAWVMVEEGFVLARESDRPGMARSVGRRARRHRESGHPSHHLAGDDHRREGMIMLRRSTARR